MQRLESTTVGKLRQFDSVSTPDQISAFVTDAIKDFTPGSNITKFEVYPTHTTIPANDLDEYRDNIGEYYVPAEYKAGDMVYSEPKGSYICKTDCINVHPGYDIETSLYWEEISDYVDGNTYLSDDIIRDGKYRFGSQVIFKCIVESTNVRPAEDLSSQFWEACNRPYYSTYISDDVVIYEGAFYKCIKGLPLSKGGEGDARNIPPAGHELSEEYWEKLEDQPMKLHYQSNIYPETECWIMFNTKCKTSADCDVVIDWGDGSESTVVATDSSGAITDWVDYEDELGNENSYSSFWAHHDYSSHLHDEGCTAYGKKFIVTIAGQDYFSIKGKYDNVKYGHPEHQNIISRVFERDLPIASNVKTVNAMCNNAYRLLAVCMPTGGLPNNIINYASTFAQCTNLQRFIATSYFVNTGRLRNVGSIFQGCVNLNEDIKNIEHFFAVVPSDRNLSYIFSNCKKLYGELDPTMFWKNDFDCDLTEAFKNTSDEILEQVPVVFGGTSDEKAYFDMFARTDALATKSELDDLRTHDPENCRQLFNKHDFLVSPGEYENNKFKQWYLANGKITELRTAKSICLDIKEVEYDAQILLVHRGYKGFKRFYAAGFNVPASELSVGKTTSYYSGYSDKAHSDIPLLLPRGTKSIMIWFFNSATTTDQFKDPDDETHINEFLDSLMVEYSTEFTGYEPYYTIKGAGTSKPLAGNTYDTESFNDLRSLLSAIIEDLGGRLI